MEVVEGGFSIKKNKAKRKVIGGLGDVTDACISPESVQTSVNEAMSFEEGFAAIIKAGLAGLAFNVLQPYLQKLQENFLESQLMSATEKGRESACATLDEVEVTYRKLFEDPNPLYRKIWDPEGYAKFSNEPSAVARNIFSDLFPRDQPIRKLTEQEGDTLMKMPVIDWPNSELAIARQLASRRREIIERFRKAGFSMDGSLDDIRLETDDEFYPGEHFDNMDAEGIQVLIPITDTIGTILRSCQTGDIDNPPCNPDTLAADLENTPRLDQGDAHFFHGGLMMHDAPLRAKGDVWMIKTLDNKEKLTIREVIERLKYARNW